jgi:hypothetical protein
MRTRFVSAVRGKRLTGIASLVIIAAVLAGWSATGYAQADPKSSQSLAGAWNVKIEFDTPGVEGCTAPGVLSADGGIVASGCSLAEGPGYGRWVRTGNNQFETTFIGQGFDLTTGAINSTYKVRARARLSQDLQQFSGPFVTDVFALDGTLVFTATGLVTADRVNVEPLP